MTYLVRMRSKFRPAAVALVLVAALAATGCAPKPAAPHTPAPTSTPLFASDEEALAAAEEAYAAYLSVTDAIFEGGAEDLSSLESVATGTQLDADTAGFEEVFANGFRSTGSTTFRDVRLQRSAADNQDVQQVVVVYLCEDVSRVDVFDSTGASVVQANRPDTTQYEVTFDVASPSDAALLVSDKVPWGDGTCSN